MTAILEDVRDTAKRAVNSFHGRANGGLDFSEGSLSIAEEMLGEASSHAGDMAEPGMSNLVRLSGPPGKRVLFV